MYCRIYVDLYSLPYHTNGILLYMKVVEDIKSAPKDGML